MTIVFDEVPHFGNSAVFLLLHAGDVYGRKSGYAHLMEHMLLKGSLRYPNSFAINNALDQSGSFKQLTTSLETIEIRLESASKNLELITKILADAVINPVWDQSVFASEKGAVAVESKVSFQNLYRQAIESAYQTLFKKHPLSSNVLGKKSDIDNMTIANLKDYHRKFFRPERSVLVVSGPKQALAKFAVIAKKEFGSWQKSKTPKPIRNRRLPRLILPKRGLHQIKGHNPQTIVRFDFRLQPVSPKEHLALEVFSTFLAYGYSSLLYQKLRQEKGLIYGVAAYTQFFRSATVFSIETATTKPKELIEIVKKIILPPDGIVIDQTSFVQYKNRFKNRLARQLAYPWSRASTIADLWHLYDKIIYPNQIYSAIDQLSYKETVNFYTKNITSKNLLITTVGKL